MSVFGGMDRDRTASRTLRCGLGPGPRGLSRGGKGGMAGPGGVDESGERPSGPHAHAPKEE